MSASFPQYPQSAIKLLKTGTGVQPCEGGAVDEPDAYSHASDPSGLRTFLRRSRIVDLRRSTDFDFSCFNFNGWGRNGPPTCAKFHNSDRFG
jgi:hypothetical protein